MRRKQLTNNDDFKLTKNFGLRGLYKNDISAVGVKMEDVVVSDSNAATPYL